MGVRAIGEVTKMQLLPSGDNLGSIFALFYIHPEETDQITFFVGSPILGVQLVCDVPEIDPAVVILRAIPVVNFCGRPSSGHVKPSKAVR